MTAQEIREARVSLGEMWGLGRPLKASEFGRVLGFEGRDPGRHVLDMEKGKHAVSGPIGLAVRLMLDGGRPPDLDARLRTEAPETSDASEVDQASRQPK